MDLRDKESVRDLVRTRTSDGRCGMYEDERYGAYRPDLIQLLKDTMEF